MNTALLYDKYGITSFVLAGGGRVASTIYYTIEETLKTQKPKLMVIEISNILNEDNYYKYYYGNILPLKWSDTYLKNVNSRNIKTLK